MADQTSGPKAYYRPKKARAMVRLTELGRDILDATAKRTSKTRADVLEQLLRRFANQVQFDKQTDTAQV